MRIEAPARIRRPIPLVPLVDVVFLLLMFFMLSSTFSKFSNLELAAGSSASAAPAGVVRKPAVPGVIINVAKGPRIRINGIERTLDEMVATLDKAYENGARAGAVVLAQTAEVQDLVSVLERARQSNLTTITVMR